HRLRPPGRLAHEEARLGDHRLTGQERRLETAEGGSRPRVIFVAPVEERDDRAGIDDHLPHSPNPSRCLTDVERSRAPASEPASSPAAARADVPGCATYAVTASR